MVTCPRNISGRNPGLGPNSGCSYLGFGGGGGNQPLSKGVSVGLKGESTAGPPDYRPRPCVPTGLLLIRVIVSSPFA